MAISRLVSVAFFVVYVSRMFRDRAMNYDWMKIFCALKNHRLLLFAPYVAKKHLFSTQKSRCNYFYLSFSIVFSCCFFFFTLSPQANFISSLSLFIVCDFMCIIMFGNQHTGPTVYEQIISFHSMIFNSVSGIDPFMAENIFILCSFTYEILYVSTYVWMYADVDCGRVRFAVLRVFTLSFGESHLCINEFEMCGRYKSFLSFTLFSPFVDSLRHK